MNKKTLSLLAAASIALFSACSNVVESTDSQAKLNVLVKDASTGNPVSGATVKLLSGDEGKTDANGFAVFSGVPIGYQSVRVDASKYASVIADIRVQGSPSVAVENNEIIEIPQTVTLTGSAYYEDEDYNLFAAEGATIRIILDKSSYDDYSLVNEALETKVGADGKYTFEVPADFNNSIVYGLEYKSAEGIVYNPVSVTTLDFTLGSTPTVGDIIYDNTAVINSFQLLGPREIRYPTPTLADSTREIVLNFTDSIDIANSGSGAISVSGSTPIDKIYSNGNKTVTIKPFGKWQENFSIYISGLRSGEGRYLSVTISVYFEAKPGLIEAPPTVAVASALPTPKISWSEVKNATGYRILLTASNGDGSYYNVGSSSHTCVPNAVTGVGLCTSDDLAYYITGSGVSYLGVTAASATGVKAIVQAYTTNNASQSSSAPLPLN
jgi:hypothetical protein